MTQDNRLDFDREARIGLPEAILCEGKSPAQIADILAAWRQRLDAALLTRLSPDQLAELPAGLQAEIDHDPLSRTGIWGRWQAPEGPPRVAVVTAGTSDLPVAREALRTLAFHGEATELFADIGVAGLWRLTERLEALRQHRVVIVAAGMEGALFSVVGGLVGGLVIALPTGQGYGVSAGGRLALDSALASCAPGIAVVNIGNGYGAACIALRALRSTAPLED